MEGEGFEPPNPKERIYSPPRLASSLPFQNINKWRETESNRRHMELQSIALPTELPSQNCGNRIWTYDLRVMSPTSYLTAPSHFASVTLISVKVNLTLGFINYLKNVLPYPNIKLFLTLVKLSLDISLKYLLQTQKTVGLWSPFFFIFIR